MELKDLTGKIIKLSLVMKLYSSERLSNLGVHFGQMPILEYIYEHDGCTQIEIADYLNVSPASIALSTKRIEKAGLLVKVTNPDNLRCKNLSLTAKGKLVYKSGHKIRDEQDVQLYSGLSDEELETLNMLLDKMTLNLTKEKENIVGKGAIDELVKQIEKLNNKN